MQEVIVLRYGHRPVRDYRVTSHCCLVARAFGSQKIIIAGPEDKKLLENIEKINGRWGSDFKLEFAKTWKPALKDLKNQGFKAAHLTMYGEPVDKKIDALRKEEKIVVIIGSQKVEKPVFEESDYNIAIGNQPHSEISALAVFLDRFFKGKSLDKKFKNAEMQIVPQRKGKKVIELK